MDVASMDVEADEEAQQHKRKSQAWRESLHALAQNLKCPICLGYVIQGRGKEGKCAATRTHTHTSCRTARPLAG